MAKIYTYPHTYPHTRTFSGQPPWPHCAKCKFLVGIDGTDYGYTALEHAFRLAQENDEIIAYHIPLDAFQFAYEHILFTPGNRVSNEEKNEYSIQRNQFIDTIEKDVMRITQGYNHNKVCVLCTLYCLLHVYYPLFFLLVRK